MTVNDLVKMLEKYPGETELLLSSDPEGNDFHWLAEVFFGALYEEEDEERYPSEAAERLGLEDKNYLVLWP